MRPHATEATAARCPSCGGPVDVRAPAVSRRVTCRSCGSLLAVGRDGLAYVDTLEKQLLWKEDFPIGSEATIGGVTYTLVGYMHCDAQTRRPEVTRNWFEYLLYSPQVGHRRILCVPRSRSSVWWWNAIIHRWVFLEPLPPGDIQFPADRTRAGEIGYKGSTFRKRDYCRARVRGLLGEFHWNVRVGEHHESAYYTRSTEMLAMEQTGDRISWYLGRTVPKEALNRAFDPQSGAANPVALDEAKAR
jgi:hypothetical protein